MEWLTKISNFFAKLTVFRTKVSSALKVANETIDGLQSKVAELEGSANSKVMELQAAVNKLENELFTLGAVKLIEVSSEEFNVLVEGTKVVTTEGTDVIRQYYRGPKLIGQKVRWPNRYYHYKAVYDLTIDL